MQTNQQSLADLEKHHKEATAETEKCFIEHGDSNELRTMREGLRHIEAKIGELQIEIQESVQEIRNEVDDLNTKVLDELQEIEAEIIELRNGNEP